MHPSEDNPTDGGAVPEQAASHEHELDLTAMVEFWGDADEDADSQFGQLSPDAIQLFDLSDFPHVSADVHFEVEHRYLLTIKRLAEGTLAAGRSSTASIKLIVSNETLAVRCYDNGVLFEVKVRLFSKAIGIDGDKTIPVVITYLHLSQAISGVSGVARFSLQVNQQRLVVSSSRFERPIPVLAEAKYLDIQAQVVGEADSASKMIFAPQELQKILADLAIAIDPLADHAPWKVASMQNGFLAAAKPGSADLVAIIEDERFTQDFRLRNRGLAQIEAVVAGMLNAVVVERAGTYWLIHDDSTLIGIETTIDPFKDLTALLRPTFPVDGLILPKISLLQHLPSLQASVEPDNPVMLLRIRKGGQECRCTLQTRRGGGRSVAARLQARREGSAEQPVDWYLSPISLLSAVRRSVGTNVSLRFYTDPSSTPRRGFCSVVADEADGSRTAYILAARSTEKPPKKKPVHPVDNDAE